MDSFIATNNALVDLVDYFEGPTEIIFILQYSHKVNECKMWSI